MQIHTADIEGKSASMGGPMDVSHAGRRGDLTAFAGIPEEDLIITRVGLQELSIIWPVHMGDKARVSL